MARGRSTTRTQPLEPDTQDCIVVASRPPLITSKQQSQQTGSKKPKKGCLSSSRVGNTSPQREIEKQMQTKESKRVSFTSPLVTGVREFDVDDTVVSTRAHINDNGISSDAPPSASDVVTWSSITHSGDLQLLWTLADEEKLFGAGSR